MGIVCIVVSFLLHLGGFKTQEIVPGMLFSFLQTLNGAMLWWSLQSTQTIQKREFTNIHRHKQSFQWNRCAPDEACKAGGWRTDRGLWAAAAYNLLDCGKTNATDVDTQSSRAQIKADSAPRLKFRGVFFSIGGGKVSCFYLCSLSTPVIYIYNFDMRFRTLKQFSYKCN